MRRPDKSLNLPPVIADNFMTGSKYRKTNGERTWGLTDPIPKRRNYFDVQDARKYAASSIRKMEYVLDVDMSNL